MAAVEEAYNPSSIPLKDLTLSTKNQYEAREKIEAWVREQGIGLGDLDVRDKSDKPFDDWTKAAKESKSDYVTLKWADYVLDKSKEPSDDWTKAAKESKRDVITNRGKIG